MNGVDGSLTSAPNGPPTSRLQTLNSSCLALIASPQILLSDILARTNRSTHKLAQTMPHSELYSPLTDPAREIRLLTLLPSDNFEVPINGVLEVVPPDASQQQYKALLYS